MSEHKRSRYQRQKGTEGRDERVVPVEVEWKPVTLLGKKIKSGEITDIEDVFKQGYIIQEAQVVNTLLPDLQEDLLLIGQAKGKFGGGQRRIFRQTQKKTCEGNSIHFSTYALVGNKNGYVGGGMGKAKETVPSRDKSKRQARLNLIRVRRGCGSWQCNCHEPHSIPFEVTGKCGSSEIRLIPAPKGKGLCIEKECAKILAMAGIEDIWSKSSGQTKTKINLIEALLDGLKKISKLKITSKDIQQLGIVDGRLKDESLPVTMVSGGASAAVLENVEKPGNEETGKELVVEETTESVSAEE